ncbi:unnamed protein product [Caenorhabditis auriculariae]|uniref:Uncharacterized protein n=1 Tax=Caenorhabditis auriculariae TaxID=2777116 RepID=A0A8S1HQT2_9PELO|nr:unnamed protein product [Caenorhabditis auriculariae]
MRNSTIDPLRGSSAFTAKPSTSSGNPVSASATALLRFPVPPASSSTSSLSAAAFDNLLDVTDSPPSTSTATPLLQPPPPTISLSAAAAQLMGMDMTSTAAQIPFSLRNSGFRAHQPSVSQQPEINLWGTAGTGLQPQMLSADLLLSLQNVAAAAAATSPLSPFLEATKALQLSAAARAVGMPSTSSVQQMPTSTTALGIAGASPSLIRKISADVASVSGLTAYDFAQQLAKTSPHGGSLPPKREPSSSSNSQPGTPSQAGGLVRVVPACSICGTDSTGIHFGVDACAACSAFFRRTVVLDKKYTCNKDNRCVVLKDGSAGQKCRSCRFKKCLTAGMDRNAVQHRRDAIGKYSAGVKKGCFARRGIRTTSEASRPDAGPAARATRVDEPSRRRSALAPALSQSPTMLQELLTRQRYLLEQRQLFYARRSLEELFTVGPPPSAGEEEIYELTDFNDCMYHLWKIEPRLAADFINRNRFLANVPAVEKIKIYKNFVVLRQAIEEPFLTWKHGGLEKERFVMPNRTFIDLSDHEKYFQDGSLKDLKLDLDTTKRLFMPSFKNAMETVSKSMRDINLTEVEMVALLGIVLFDPSIATLQEETRLHLQGLRDMLLADIHNFYDEEEETNSESPEIRVAELLMVVANVKIHAIRTSENMQILRIFDLIRPDPIFNQTMEPESPPATLATAYAFPIGIAVTSSDARAPVGRPLESELVKEEQTTPPPLLHRSLSEVDPDADVDVC